MAPTARPPWGCQPRRAWGAHAGVALQTVVPGSSGKPEPLPTLLQRIQAYVFQRRVRVKDNFLDFDPLRSGRCTPQQFVRAVSQLVPTLAPAESDALVEHFIEQGPNVTKPQVVNYRRFVRSVDEVFAVPDLEKAPTFKVPKPGTSLSNVGFRPAEVADEAELQRLVSRLALLSRTRGVVFRCCFQDAERSHATSLMCPRYSGKVTQAQFLQHFPFAKEFSEAELGVLLDRYSTEAGDMNYLALHRDIEASPESEDKSPQDWRLEAGPHGSLPSRMSSQRHGERRLGSQDGFHREPDVVDKLKAIIAGRRLPLYGAFQDFDRLRRGVCSPGQVGTVFTILRIELSSQELEELCARFQDTGGMFNYQKFCRAMSEVVVPTMTDWAPCPSSAHSLAELSGGLWSSRQRALLVPEAEAELEEAISWVARCTHLRALRLKSCFQDFDRTRCGRVTKNQFLRIFDMLNIQLTQQQADVLCEAYCDAAGREFGYQDLCAAVEQRNSQVDGHSPTAYSTRSKYFNRRGQITPLAPLLSARPCTR